MDRDQADGRALALKLDGPEAFYKQGRTLRLAAFLWSRSRPKSRTGKDSGH
jgi:hypothetical protein